MAKLTLNDITEFVGDYVLAANQAGSYSATTANFLGLVDKIGKIVTLDGDFQDKLAMLNGDDLPYGKTIEEYFIDLTLPVAYTDATTDGAEDIVPAVPSVESAAYNYTLGRYKIKTTEPYDNVERAALGAESSATMISKIMQRLNQSVSLTKYNEKKQLIGNLLTKITAALATNAGLASSIAVPVDESTGEAFIQEVKECIEDASFANEGNNLGNCLIGAAPSMYLFVKKGIMPALEVKTLAGAFHKEDLAIPAEVIVVDDFGENDDYYAVLMDSRTIRLHNGYSAVRSKENADGDFINFVAHEEDTGFISKYTYVHAFKAPANA